VFASGRNPYHGRLERASVGEFKGLDSLSDGFVRRTEGAEHFDFGVVPGM
jgi:hypothetical protein